MPAKRSKLKIPLAPTNAPVVAPPVTDAPPPVVKTPPPVTNAPSLVTNTPPPGTNPPPLGKLEWDATMKEYTLKLGETVAKFTFNLTNTSLVDVVITSVKPSCGCTTGKMPPLPWKLAPGTNGEMSFNVNVAAKSGTVVKSVTVASTAATNTLQLKVNIPDAQMERTRNQEMAARDRQLVFKGDCARCHLDPGQGKMSEALYRAVCGVCHEAEHKATMVADLHKLNHPTNAEHWRTWITSGKPDSLMPAFATAQGGPLSNEQIESLVEYLVKAIPSVDTNAVPATVTTNAAPASTTP
jgi:cytochrome c553